MKKILILLVSLTMGIFLCSCSKVEEKEFYGTYADAKSFINAEYEKSYLIMDCCEEWNQFKAFVENIKGIGAAEGFEYYFYDQNENIVTPKKPVEIIFHPTEDFKRRSGECAVCSYPEGYLYKCEELENGDLKFTTDKDGIFVAVKYSGYKLWISNLSDCNNQCRTCSDEW